MEMRIVSAWKVAAPYGKCRAVPPREKVWQRPCFVRPLIFLFGDQKAKWQVCTVLTLVALDTSLGCVGISSAGQEAYGGWPMETPHTSVLVRSGAS